MDVSGKTALVFGGTSGIGLAAAKQLAEKGCKVVAISRSPERAGDVPAGITLRKCDVLDRAGIEALAYKVVALAESGQSQFAPLYPDELGLFDKIDTIVKRIYRGSEAIADKSVRDQLRRWEAEGYGTLPICMAKTQYSFSTDPNLRGAPEGHTVPVREVRLSAGAGFIVVITGEIMTMPGLPKSPSSERIFLNDLGQIEGLF